VGEMQQGTEDKRSLRKGLARERRDLLAGMDSPLEETTEISVSAVMRLETAAEMWPQWDEGEAFNEMQFITVDTGS